MRESLAALAASEILRTLYFTYFGLCGVIHGEQNFRWSLVHAAITSNSTEASLGEEIADHLEYGRRECVLGFPHFVYVVDLWSIFNMGPDISTTNPPTFAIATYYNRNPRSSRHGVWESNSEGP